jgi:sensor histidine kinase YesM
MRSMGSANPFSATDRYHPLEIIPFFRRFPCSGARNLLYTLIWNCLFGLFFLLVNTGFTGRLPSAHLVWAFFVMSNFIGFAIHALYKAGSTLGLEARARRGNVGVKMLYFSGIPLIGAVAGLQASDWVIGIGFGQWLTKPSWLISILAVNLVISSVLAAIFLMRERQASAEAALASEREVRERVQREAAASNLRALQAQIEPHFLFNTLANVSSLIDREPAVAKRMLERFNQFLRATLAATRTERTTLGAEGELIRAYLDVLQVRMGPRLEYRVDVAPELAASPIAPMLLQPVVENAIRHGVEPKIEGGRVDFVVRRDGDAAVVEVRDTGVGFAATTTGGVGLTNLRDRLRGLYGARASLTIGENAAGGTVVTVRVPA